MVDQIGGELRLHSKNLHWTIMAACSRSDGFILVVFSREHLEFSCFFDAYEIKQMKIKNIG